MRRRRYDEAAILDAESACLELTEQVVAAMQRQGLKRRDIAQRLRTTKGRVTQLLDGPNFTFRTAARLAWASGLRFTVVCEEEEEEGGSGEDKEKAR